MSAYIPTDADIDALGALPLETAPLPETAAEAREQGFSAAEVEDLRAAGIIAREQWAPETTADVEWIARQLEACDTEENRRRDQLERHLAAIQRRRESLARFEPLCFAITRAAIPRKKDGSLARKSFDGDEFRLRITEREPTPRVTDEAALIELFRITADPDHLWMCEAIRATVVSKLEVWGSDALDVFDRHEPDETVTLKVLSAPVLAYLATLPPVQELDEHGAVIRETPALIPGVELTERVTAWSYESGRKGARDE